MFWETPKSFMGGWWWWWYVAITESTQVQTSWIWDRDWIGEDLGGIWDWPGDGLDPSLTIWQIKNNPTLNVSLFVVDKWFWIKLLLCRILFCPFQPIRALLGSWKSMKMLFLSEQLQLIDCSWLDATKAGEVCDIIVMLTSHSSTCCLFNCQTRVQVLSSGECRRISKGSGVIHPTIKLVRIEVKQLNSVQIMVPNATSSQRSPSMT